MGWLSFDEARDLVCGDDPVEIWRAAMQALWARRAWDPPEWDELLDAALVQLNRHGAAWIEPWPGPLQRLHARTPAGAVVASSGGGAPRDPRTLAVIGRTLEEISLSYEDSFGLGRKPRLEEVLYYLRDVAPWVRTPPALVGGEIGRTDLLYQARGLMTGAPLPANATVEADLGEPPPGAMPTEDALFDGARWWLGDAGEMVCEATADILRDRLERGVTSFRDGEFIPFEPFILSLFDLANHDYDGFFEDAPAFQGRALALHAGGGEPRLVVRQLSEEEMGVVDGFHGPIGLYALATSNLYLSEVQRKPRIAELFACVSYALNLLDLRAWLSGIPEERPLRITVVP